MILVQRQRRNLAEQFNASAQKLTALRVRDLSQEDAQRLQTVMGDMFDLFNTNGDGVVDISELFSSLTVLCRGGSSTLAIKSAAAFSV